MRTINSDLHPDFTMKLKALTSLALAPCLITLAFTSCKEKSNPKTDDTWELEHRNMSGSGTNSEGAGGGAPMSDQPGQDKDRDLQPQAAPPTQPQPEVPPQPPAQPPEQVAPQPPAQSPEQAPAQPQPGS